MIVEYSEEQEKKPPMHGKPWTKFLCEKLKMTWLEYSKNTTNESEIVIQLAKDFERTEKSILFQLCNLKLLDGYDEDGYDEDGYDVIGIDREGINQNGWNEHLQSLSLEVLIFQKRSSYFYKLREKKRTISKKFLDNGRHYVGNYYSWNRNPDEYVKDPLTKNIIKNKNEINGTFPAQNISKLMCDYLTDNNLGSFDCIIPVGNHPENSEQLTGGVSIAQELSKLLNVEYCDVLKKTLNIKARTIPNINKREFWDNNDLYVFSGSHEIKDKKILLVDDIITHDYTMTQCIYQLGYESPKDITVLCAGRTMK